MTSRLFTVAASLSLLLCVLTCGAWAWSFNHPAVVFDTSRLGSYYLIGAYHGRGYCRDSVDLRPPPPEATTMQWVRSRPVTRSEWMGFEYSHGEEVPYEDLSAVGLHSFVHEYVKFRSVFIPLWVIAALTLLAPLVWIRRWRRERVKRLRHKEGFCPRCGYDLRFSKDRCPECGGMIPLNVPRQASGSPHA